MSNDKAALFDQVSKTLELVREGKRSVAFASRVLQAFNSDDDIRITSLVGQKGSWYRIASNYNSAAEAIEATECPLRWGYAEKPAEIPMITQPVHCRVKPVPLGQRMTSAEVYAKYGPKLVDPNRLFTFGANHPEFQLKQLVGTLWMYNGQLWYACLCVDGAGRRVNVYPIPPGGEWSADSCVLLGE